MLKMKGLIEFSIFALFYCVPSINAITCYCGEIDGPATHCNNKDSCTEDGGLCIVITERLSDHTTRRYRCLEATKVHPVHRPFLCEPTNQTKHAITCCFENYCNKDLDPPAIWVVPNPPTSKESGKLDSVDGLPVWSWPVIFICFVILLVFLGVLYFFTKIKDKCPNRSKHRFVTCKHSESNTDIDPILMPLEPSVITTSSGAGPPILILQTIARQIKLLDLVGRGRYGEVHRGIWRGEEVAVKKFVTRDEQSWFRETEIYQTVMLRHDNILRFIAADNKDNGSATELWLVSEYHQNGSLFDHLGCNKVTVAEMLKFSVTIASGLAHLHMEIIGTQGKPPIAHRDLKSKNILVKKNGECAIADLGLAVRYNSCTDTIDISPNSRVGTKRYMAPEVLNDSMNTNNFDSFRRADIYSLGLVFWEIAHQCNVSDQDSGYKLPYYDCVPDDPSIEEMKLAVCFKKRRPLKEELWKQHESLSAMWKLMQECWYEKECARLSALRVKKTIVNMLMEQTVKM